MSLENIFAPAKKFQVSGKIPPEWQAQIEMADLATLHEMHKQGVPKHRGINSQMRRRIERAIVTTIEARIEQGRKSLGNTNTIYITQEQLDDLRAWSKEAYEPRRPDGLESTDRIDLRDLGLEPVEEVGAGFSRSGRGGLWPVDHVRGEPAQDPEEAAAGEEG